MTDVSIRHQTSVTSVGIEWIGTSASTCRWCAIIKTNSDFWPSVIWASKHHAVNFIQWLASAALQWDGVQPLACQMWVGRWKTAVSECIRLRMSYSRDPRLLSTGWYCSCSHCLHIHSPCHLHLMPRVALEQSWCFIHFQLLKPSPCPP